MKQCLMFCACRTRQHSDPPKATNLWRLNDNRAYPQKKDTARRRERTSAIEHVSSFSVKKRYITLTVSVNCLRMIKEKRMENAAVDGPRKPCKDAGCQTPIIKFTDLVLTSVGHCT